MNRMVYFLAIGTQNFFHFDSSPDRGIIDGILIHLGFSFHGRRSISGKVVQFTNGLMGPVEYGLEMIMFV